MKVIIILRIKNKKTTTAKSGIREQLLKKRRMMYKPEKDF